MEINHLLNIFLSVFAGILTYIIIEILKLIFNKIIIPWYQDKIYRGFDISGIWTENHNYENMITQESEIHISQNAHNILGKISLIKKGDDGQILGTKNFEFKGEFYNNFLNITCWNADKKQIGTHNYLMKIERDGKEMDGFKTYFDIGFGKIRSQEIFWTRKDFNGF